MKHILGFILLIACAASCSSRTGHGGTSTYSDDAHGFRFRYPKEWTRLPAGGNAVVMFTGGKTNRQITVSREKGSETEIAVKLKQFRTFFPEYKELEAGWTSVNGRRAYLQTVQWNTPLGDIKAFRLLVPVGDHFFTVCAATPRKEFEQYAPLLRFCVMSFEVTQE